MDCLSLVGIHKSALAGGNPATLNLLPRKPVTRMSLPWEERWERVTSDGERSGGQATVIRLRSKTDDRIGALKTLHERQQRITERRFRVQQEVYALSVTATGVPQVYESNVEQWADKDVPLYVVMEWIPGPTLTQSVGRRPIGLDAALICTNRLLETLDACHRLGITHRDLKPDNVILRDGNPAQPVLVDFGIASTEQGEDKRAFNTDIGQEMGNRFLRLPEFAPGRISRDARSDLTLLAGLLLFMVSGFVPRVLRDEHDRLPHEAAAAAIPEEHRRDPRWPRLERVFRRAFQTPLDMRFSTADDLRNALQQLRPETEASDALELALERLKEVSESEAVKRLHNLQEVVDRECGNFVDTLSRLSKNAGFIMLGDCGYDQTGRVYRITLGITRQSGGATVSYNHEVHISETEFVARYNVGLSHIWKEYFRGSIVDPEALHEALVRQAPTLLAELIQYYTELVRGRF
jgi:serine/threonine protein kinase